MINATFSHFWQLMLLFSEYWSYYLVWFLINELGGRAATPTTSKFWWTDNFWARSGDHGMYFKEVQKRGKHTHTYQQWLTNWWKHIYFLLIYYWCRLPFFSQRSMDVDIHMHTHMLLCMHACTLTSMNTYEC